MKGVREQAGARGRTGIQRAGMVQDRLFMQPTSHGANDGLLFECLECVLG